MKRLFTSWANNSGFFVLVIAMPVMLMFLSCAQENSNKGTEIARDFDVIFSGDKTFDWPDARLEERFADYWALRFEGEMDKIYRMEAPYFRTMVPEAQYRNYVRGSGRNTLHRIEIFDIALRTDNFAEVPITLHFSTDSGREQSVSRRDRWVLSGGEWTHVIRDPIIFPAAS